jgi:hypothetical protein
MRRREFITLLGGAASLAAPRIGRAQYAIEPKAVAYPGFAGNTYQRVPYVGRGVALLLDPVRKVERALIERVLDGYDRGYDWYRETLGREPAPGHTYLGRLTIAEAPAAECGGAPACGLTGSTGIQLAPEVIDLDINDAMRDCANGTVFYEFGRNFFFCTQQTADDRHFHTGFARLNGILSLDDVGLVGSASYTGGLDYGTFRYAVLVDLLNRYLADPKLTWQNTIGAGTVPANPYPSLWSIDLMAAFFNLIRRDHGMEGYRRFWRAMAGAAPAKDLREAMGRYVQIARAVVGEDYRELLRDKSLPVVAMLKTPTSRGIESYSLRNGGAVFLVVKRQQGNAFTQAGNTAGSTVTYHLLAETAEEAYLLDAANDSYAKLDFVRRTLSWRNGTEGDWTYYCDISDLTWRG